MNWMIATLAITFGFLAALLLFRPQANSGTTATTATPTTAIATTPATTPGAPTQTTPGAPTQTTPANPQASLAACIDLWNQPANRGPQTFLVNLVTREPTRVHVGTTSQVPPECAVTLVANDGTAYTFSQGGGTPYPYAPTAAQGPSSALPAGAKISNALDQRDGTLTAR